MPRLLGPYSTAGVRVCGLCLTHVGNVQKMWWKCAENVLVCEKLCVVKDGWRYKPAAGLHKRDADAAYPQPASQPASRLSNQLASYPTSQPAIRPASQPACQHAGQPVSKTSSYLTDHLHQLNNHRPTTDQPLTNHRPTTDPLPRCERNCLPAVRSAGCFESLRRSTWWDTGATSGASGQVWMCCHGCGCRHAGLAVA
eukprot:365461-Chlamydomonas_euryale.AAC.6